jgi:hypothetical protein
MIAAIFTVFQVYIPTDAQENNERLVSYPVSYAKKTGVLSLDDMGLNGWVEIDVSDGYQPSYSTTNLQNTEFVYKNIKSGQSIEFWKNHRIPREIRIALVKAVDAKPHKLLKSIVLRVTSFDLDGDWAVLSIAELNDEIFNSKGAEYKDGTSLLFRMTSRGWEGAIRRTKKFRELVNDAPIRVLENRSKQYFNAESLED